MLNEFCFSSSHQIDVVCEFEVTKNAAVDQDSAGKVLQDFLRGGFEEEIEECWWQNTSSAHSYVCLECGVKFTSIEYC